jgi:hypothetical protein
MNDSRVAAVLSFVVPGAGLWYAGYRWWAALNLAAALLIALLGIMFAPDFFSEYAHYVVLAIAAASAGIAHAAATRKFRPTQP